MVDLVAKVRAALKEIAAAPLDWNGYEMAALAFLALAVFVLALIATGAIDLG